MILNLPCCLLVIYPAFPLVRGGADVARVAEHFVTSSKTCRIASDSRFEAMTQYIPPKVRRDEQRERYLKGCRPTSALHLQGTLAPEFPVLPRTPSRAVKSWLSKTDPRLLDRRHLVPHMTIDCNSYAIIQLTTRCSCVGCVPSQDQYALLCAWKRSKSVTLNAYSLRPDVSWEVC